jgi:lysophospholipase L1-like esterase
MPVRVLLPGALLAGLLTAPGVRAVEPFTLKDGDRVVLLGSALIEHERFHGYLEARLIRRFPEAAITFRNLGWSGDTVRGSARTSGFQEPDGFARLLKEVKALGPTVLFLGYGTNESFGGPGGLSGFLEGYSHLLDQLAPLKARIVVLSPTCQEDLGRPYPEPTEHNRNLEQYTAALKKLAGARKLWFVDLFHPLQKARAADPPRRLTTNGLLPSAHGYRVIAEEIERQLLGLPAGWSVEVDLSGKVLAVRGAELRGVKAAPNALRFDLLPAILPAPGEPGTTTSGPGRLRVADLPPVESVKYYLSINDGKYRVASSKAWARGVELWPEPVRRQAEELRAAIVKKDGHFYRRWRPYNDHERHWGFIGGDFRLYDAEIAQDEAVIARLRRPAPLHLELERERAK